jgi:hypothetical protein
MVKVLTSSAVECGFEPRSDQTKNYKIGMCCFSARLTVLRRKNKYLLGSESEYCVRVKRHVYPQTACWSSIKQISLSRQM